MHLDVEQLVAHVAGELDAVARAQVVAHLAECARCRKTSAELVRTERPRDAASLIGQDVGGYRVQELIGTGAFSEVYRATEPTVGRVVALKVLKPEPAAKADVARRLLEEARAANAIRHPGLVDVHAFGHAPDGRPYLVMELLEGRTLEQLMVSRGRLPETEGVALLRGILEPLSAAHRAGVLHRDLKPSNVFICGARVKLLDLGLAKTGVEPGRVAAQTAGLTVGTPAYTAPEQALGHAIGATADLYAVGVMAYELLTGELPFELGVQAVTRQRPVPVLPSWVSPQLAALVASLLEYEPARRPKSAADVLRALDYPIPVDRPTEVAGRPAYEAPTDVEGRPAFSAPPRRRGLSAALLALALVAAAGAAAWWLAAG